MTQPLPSSAQAYLDRLPLGLDSYPDARQKATISASLVEHWPAIREVALPSALYDLVHRPPPPNVWVPEVQGIALWLVAKDVVCGGDAERFNAFARDLNRHLLAKPLYGFVMRLLGPRLTARAVNATWSSFHRGVEQTAVIESGRATIVVRYPPHLMPPPIVASFGTAFEAALEVAGVHGAVARVVSCDDKEATYTIEW